MIAAARRALREQQDAEFAAALAADRRREEALRTELRRKQAEDRARAELLDLQKALAETLPPEPESGGVLVAFSARDVRRERRFPDTSPVSALYDFVRACPEMPNRFRLMAVPRGLLENSTEQLTQALGKASRVRLIVEPQGKFPFSWHIFHQNLWEPVRVN